MTETRILRALGAELRTQMSLSRITQKELAAATGIGTSTLRRYLQGERDIPVGTLSRIADALDVPAGRLLDEAARRARQDADDHTP